MSDVLNTKARWDSASKTMMGGSQSSLESIFNVNYYLAD